MELQSCTKKGNSGYSSFDEEKFQTINTSISSTKLLNWRKVLCSTLNLPILQSHFQCKNTTVSEDFKTSFNAFSGKNFVEKNQPYTCIQQVWRKSRYLTISTSREDRAMVRRSSQCQHIGIMPSLHLQQGALFGIPKLGATTAVTTHNAPIPKSPEFNVNSTTTNICSSAEYWAYRIIYGLSTREYVAQLQNYLQERSWIQ